MTEKQILLVAQSSIYLVFGIKYNEAEYFRKCFIYPKYETFFHLYYILYFVV